MKKIISLVFILLCSVIVAQNKQAKPQAKPQFKLAGIDSGNISLSVLLAAKGIIANDPSLSIVAYDVTVGSVNGKTYAMNSYSGDFPVDLVSVFNKIKSPDTPLLYIENVKAINKSGNTTVLRNQLKLKIIP